MSRTVEEIMNMSDEEFTATNGGELDSAGSNTEENTSDNEENGGTLDQGNADQGEANASGTSGDNADTAAGTVNAGTTEETKDSLVTQEAATEPAQGDGQTQPAADSAGDDAGTQVTTAPVDYEDFYKKVSEIPFKANGKEFKVKSPEEAIRLMQQGAGAGKKMAQLAPHLKTLKTLEKYGMLSEDKINYLIDLDRKNPDAIKKLIKDSGINPLDFSDDEEQKYIPTNHSVSDAEMRFKGVLEQVREEPQGLETIAALNDWDEGSKAELWKHPEILTVMHEARRNGVYDIISTEIARQKALGVIPHEMPFVRAYEQVGRQLVENQSKTPNNGQNPGQSQTLTPAPATQNQQDQPRVLETRAAAPKPQVTNSDKAKGAAAPRQSKGKPPTSIKNLMNMSDEEFLKDFNGRF